MNKFLIILLILVVEISYAQTNNKEYITKNKSEKFSKNLRSITNIENISLSKKLIIHKIYIPKSNPRSIVFIDKKSNRNNNNYSYLSNRMKRLAGYYKDPNSNTKTYKEPSRLSKAINSAIYGDPITSSIYLVGWLLDSE